MKVMDHGMKRILSILFLILTLLSALMVPALAQEETEIEAAAGVETVLENGIVGAVNPVYEGIIEPKDLALPSVAAPQPKLKAKAKLAASSDPVFEDAEEAGDYIREQIKNHVGTITFRVRSESSDQKELYALFLQCYQAAYAHTGEPNEGDYIFYNLGGYSRYETIPWADGIADFLLAPTYLMTEEQETEVTAEVDRLIADFDFTSETTDLQKVRAIYDYLCENVVYDESEEDDGKLRHSTYAALILKSAVCQGYASAFYRMALTCGLHARIVAGLGYTSGGSENHGWNIVELDGQYYYLDATWDAARIQEDVGYIYYLRGTREGEFPNHTAGKRKDGTSVVLPDEMDEMSVENYPVELEIIRQPKNVVANWGDVPVFRIAAIGNDLTYHWVVNYGDGSGPWEPKSAGIKIASSVGGISASNRDRYDNTTLTCTVTDGEGNTRTSETVTLTVKDPVAELKGYTLSFDGDIALNFYMQLSEDVLQKEDAHMHFTIPGETEKVVDIPVSEAVPRNFTVDGQKVTYYKFTAGVAAKDMTQKVHAEFYYSDSYKTVDQYYKVKAYADYIQKHPESYSDKAIAMVQAMLNYGGYAQTNFSYHTDDMANADLEDTKLPEVKIPEDKAYRISGSLEDAAFKGARLVLRTNTIIRLYFALEGDPSDYTVTVDGQKVTPASSSLGENWIQMEIPAVPAGKLDRFYTVKITKSGSEDELTVDYCAYSNVKSVLESPTGYKESEVNMLKALYVFGEKTKAYFQK